MNDVLLLEAEELRGFIAKHVGSDILLAQQVSHVNKNKHESSVLALSRHRVILYNSRTKRVDHNINFLEINSLTSGSNSTVSLSSEKVLIQLEGTDMDAFIIQFFVLLSLSFPACKLRSLKTYKILPESREDRIVTRVESLTETGDDSITLLTTFRPAYEAFCDFYSIPPLSIVVWIIEQVYYVQKRNVFNLQDFDHLPTGHILAALSTIKFVGWFKGIKSKDKKLGTEVIQKIFALCRIYPSLNYLSLSGVGPQISDFLDVFHSADLKISSIDFSDNGLEDKSAAVLCNGIYKLTGLQHLSLSGNNFTERGLKMIVDALKQASASCPSLLTLSLDRCTNIKSDGWACFFDLLCHCVSLQELSVSDTTIPLEAIWTPLLVGCTAHIRVLNLAGTRYNSNRVSPCYQKMNRFIVTCQELSSIDMSRCKVPPDILKLLLKGLSDNILLNDVTVDISSSELGVPGIRLLGSLVPTVSSVSRLILSNNEAKTELVSLLAALHGNKGIKHLDISNNITKLKDKEMFVKCLVSLAEDKDSALQSINIANMRLKSDLTPFLECLAYNRKVLELDISGNNISNNGARLLAQSLSVNKTIRRLALDNNQISLQGFRDLLAALSLNSTLQSLAVPYQDIANSSRSNEVAAIVHQMTRIVEKNNAPVQEGDDILLQQQHFILNSSENLQLDSAVVSLYDSLTSVHGKRGDEFVKTKKEGLELLKEAEKCYQLMHVLHDKADKLRTTIYTSAANSNIFRETAEKVTNIVNKELSVLSSQYYQAMEKSLPNLLAADSTKNDIQNFCEEKCQINENSVHVSLCKTFQHELTMTIGKCMLQAETKITTLVVESMVSRLNELAKRVEDLNSNKGSTDKENEKENSNKAVKENEQDEELDESIKQRRFTYTEKRKEIVSNEAQRTASVSSLTKPRPDVPAKPAKRVSVEGTPDSDKTALFSAPDAESVKSDVDTASVKSEKAKLIKDEAVEEAKPLLKEKPAIKGKPAVSSPPELKPATLAVMEETSPEEPVKISDIKPDVEEEDTKPEGEEERVQEKVDESKETEVVSDEVVSGEVVSGEAAIEEKGEKDAKEDAVTVEEEDDVEEEIVAEEEAAVQEKVEREEETPGEVDDSEKVSEDKLTNGVESTAPSMDFNSIEDTAALTSITKSRVRGPKKKSRPTKSCAITTLDPFEVASASERTDVNGAPEPPTPEPEIKPKPKKIYGKAMMPGMGAMNSELMSKLGGKKQSADKSPEPEEAASGPATAPEETAPKKSPYRPPGAKAMPGMGFGMGSAMSSELAGKLKSRNKATEEAADKEPTVADAADERPASPTKSKSKGFFSKIDPSRPRSPGSVGSRKSSEKVDKPETRSKTWGSKKS